MHILTLFFILTTGWSANALECALFHGFQTAVRFCLVLAFLDPLVSIPFQVLYTIAESLVHCFVFEASTSTLGHAPRSQGFVFVVSIASSIFLDLALRGRIEAQLDTADAESLLGSFRRECLKHLIFTDISLRGRDFCQLMVDDSRRRFADFVATQLTVATVADGAPAGLPQGLRVSFRDVAGGFGVAADLYHDLDTELHEVQQAHWNFARCLVEGDPQAAPSESMPSLKSMVKPFAWEKLKATVQRSLALCSSSSLQ
eukprot:g7009.t1